MKVLILIFHLQRYSGQTDYIAEFDVTITNDSVYDITYSTPVYQHRINRQLDGSIIDPSYLNYQVTGINTGDIIPSKSSVTFKITISFTNPLSDEQYDTFVIDGEFTPTVTENKNARLYASIDETITGNLRGSNTSAAYTVTVMNTYDTQKTFTLSLNTDKFDIRDASMNSPAEYTINANEPGQTFTFYLVKKNGVQHYTDTERVGVLVDTDGQSQFSAGVVSVLVDQNNFYRDENAPLINNVTAEIVNTVGSATVSWSGRDIETTSPVGYTIIIYKDGVEQDRVDTTEEETNKASKTLTGLGEGTYYFTVIGEDAAGNTATQTEINNAEVNVEGHASKSSEIELKWTYRISFTLPKCTQKQSQNVTRGTNFTTTFTPNNNYAITGISITVGGRTMPTSGYTASNNNRNLTIYGDYITGDIVVTATTQSTGGGGCGV